MSTEKISFTRVNNDVNGNPRYVCHFRDMNTKQDEEIAEQAHSLNYISCLYNAAVRRAKKIGGKKYRGKDYGGGIVFQSYNIWDTERAILRLTDEG